MVTEYQCDFYGEVDIPDARGEVVKAQCPKCESIRKLRWDGYGGLHFPKHKQPDNIRFLSGDVWRQVQGKWVIPH